MFSGRILRLLLLSWLLLGMLPGKSLADAPLAPARDYTLAVIPVIPATEIKRLWQPTLDEIARASGLRFRFHFYPDIDSFEKGLQQDEVDFVVTSPVLTWKLRSHYRPLVRGALASTGLVVVSQDSPFHQLEDLQGHVVSLQEGNDLTANVFVLRDLKERKLEVQLRPLNSESSALRSVLLGKSDAAIISNHLLKLLPEGVEGQVRILHRTVELPPLALAANVRLPAEATQRFTTTLLRLRDTRPALLEGILMSGATEADLERDYGIVGRLLGPEAANGEH